MMNFQSRGLDEAAIGVSFNGFQFDYLEERWKLNRNVTINLSFLKGFSKKLNGDIRETLLYYAETHSAKHTQNMVSTLKLFLRHLEENDTFSESSLLSFKHYLGEKLEYKLGIIRGFIRQMKYLGLADEIGPNVFKLMDGWRLSGNAKGNAVLNFDPETGPFSDLELEAIEHSAAHRFAEGKITTENYSILLLYKSTGRRNEQLAALKCKDFSYTNKHTGSFIYAVNIPRIKQRRGKFRSSFRCFGLIDAVGQVIESHIEQSIKRVEDFIGRQLSFDERQELPLFYTVTMLKELKNIPKNQSLDYLKSELSHMRSSAIASRLESVTNQLNVISERTGEPIKVFPTRFRYTLGSRAASESAGILTIATLLDHSDIQNADVYVRNVPEYAVEISKIMNQPLARYAAAFSGKIVFNEDEANKENPGAARIPFQEKDCSVGSCGTDSFCTDYAPIACYVCPKFRPWANAPHHLMLEHLMEERERIKENNGGDLRIAAINDRIIVAVCQVMKACEEVNQNV